MISLRLITSGDPFEEHPQLLSLWPEPLLSLAREGVSESIEAIGAADIGAIFLIEEDNRVIGITGFFPFDESGLSLGLRWHGIIDSHRGKGLSQRVIRAVLEFSRHTHPTAEALIELVPVTPHGSASIAPHFERLGFSPDGAPQLYDWAEHPWQPYRLEIAHFLTSGEQEPTPPKSTLKR